MVGKYVHRAVLGGAAATDDGGAGGDEASTSDPLTVLVERTVRRVLAEK